MIFRRRKKKVDQKKKKETTEKNGDQGLSDQEEAAVKERLKELGYM